MHATIVRLPGNAPTRSPAEALRIAHDRWIAHARRHEARYAVYARGDDAAQERAAGARRAAFRARATARLLRQRMGA